MTSAAVNHPPRYRPDLEGMRAVAILAVIAAHAGVPGLAGGFIGVDVFFVLSGYLITGLLVQEHQANGRVDFAAFYVRRFRRLLPALLLMLGVSCVLARLLLSPDRSTRPSHCCRNFRGLVEQLSLCVLQA
jgi:peptidoglycan/LPS O-acetylase OafA/YrhL